jgi:tRNA nucleotidyltransferase (CCA-adding enzyme)
MECLDAMPPGDAVRRIAALLHDLGKPRTREWSDKTSDWTFYNHERVGADMADVWLRDYRFSNEEREVIVHLVRHHLVCYDPAWSDAAVRRFLARVGVDRVDALLALARADALGKGRPVDEELASLEELRARVDGVIAAGAALSTRDLAVNGGDVMAALGVAPGRIVGIVLRALLERVVEDPALNTKDQLLALVPVVRDEAGKGEAS